MPVPQGDFWTVVDAIQTLARDPFEWKAKQAVQERMDEAVDALNKAREDTSSADEGPTKEASAKVVAVLREVLKRTRPAVSSCSTPFRMWWTICWRP